MFSRFSDNRILIYRLSLKRYDVSFCNATIQRFFIRLNEIEVARIDEAVAEAEAEYKAGAELKDAKEALSSLRRKHIG